MLLSELLLVWKRKGKIIPRYAKFSKENLNLANILIKGQIENIGKKKKNLREFIIEKESAGYHYRFIRGLAFILDRKSRFRINSKINPLKLREKIYQTTKDYGIPVTNQQRDRIIKKVASEFCLTHKELEEGLYSDLEDELTLTEFNPPSDLDLLKEYNLSLTQTLLFNATELKFTTTDNWQKIFYAIKRLGLIYEVYLNGDFWVKINGPISLFKLTKRYGTALAKLIPLITSNSKWEIEGKVLWKYTNELCTFKIESNKHDKLLKKSKIVNRYYDSQVEAKFGEQFKGLRSKWSIKREPEPIKAGKNVIIPDFSFERGKIKIFMEIVGFWTNEYVRRKIEKLKKINVKMIVVINEELACEKIKKLEESKNLKIIYYKKNIPLAPILRYLDEPFEEKKNKEVLLIKNLPLKPTEPVLYYKELAERIGVTPQAVRKALIEKTPKGYLAFPNSLVKREKIEIIKKKINEKIEKKGNISLIEAFKIIDEEQIEDNSRVIEVLGYKILWHGIKIEDAELKVKR
jgi:predicted nuclease of restriction endonuclease-like RecB superfamily